MAATIPTTEPTSARAGDTWRWSRALADYPAPTWALTYTLYNADGKISLTAAASGTSHLVAVAPSVTEAYTAGRYDWVAHVSDGTDRHQVDAGAIEVLPDLSAVSSYDGRSSARKALDAITATIEGRATAADLDVVRTAIGDRSVDRKPEVLLTWQRHFSAIVASEDRAAAVARGEAPGTLQLRWRA